VSDTRSDPSTRRAVPFLTAELVCAGLAGTVANTSVTVAVAGIAEDFDASISRVAVLVVLLNVAMAFAMPLSGIAVRAAGARRVVAGAGGAVLASSVLVSIAPNLPVFGLARALQGVALAAVVPTSVLVSTQLLGGEDRRRALGWWAAANGLGLAFAPLIGGVLLDAAGWRWVTLPTCVLGVGLTVTAILAFPSELRHDPGVAAADVVPISVGAGTLMSVLAAAAAGAWILAGAFAAACGVSLGMIRARAGHSTALRTALGWTRDPTVRWTATGATLQMIANGMVQVAVPAWLIATGTLTGGPAGAVLMTMTLTMAVMGPVTGRTPRVSFEGWLRAGLSLTALGMVGLLAAELVAWWLTMPALLVLGVGGGALLTPSLTTFSHSVAGSNALGLSVFNVLRLGAFAVGGLAGAAALDLGGSWVAFALAGAICGAAAMFAGRTSRRPA
jgi:MFS family permease